MLFSVIDNCAKEAYHAGMLDSELRQWLKEILPDFFQKSELDILTCGVITANNLRQIVFKHPSMRPFPSYRLGRKVMVKRDELIEWLGKYNDRLYQTGSGAVCAGAGNAGEAGSAGGASERQGERA